MISVDRLKGSLFALVRAAVPRFAYAAPRFARVVSARTGAGGTTLDVSPEDPAFPSMSGVPLFHGLPGIDLTLATGTRVLVEFSEADPAKPFVRSWAGGEVVTKITINAVQVFTGGDKAAQPPHKGLLLNTAFATLVGQISAYALAIKPIADPSNAATPALTGACTAFVAATQAALALKTRVE